MKDKKLDWRTDNTYPFIWSIVVTFISAVSFYLGSYYGIKADIRDIKKDIAYLIKTQDEYFQRNKDVQVRLGIVESRQNTIMSYLENTWNFIVKP